MYRHVSDFSVLQESRTIPNAGIDWVLTYPKVASAWCSHELNFKVNFESLWRRKLQELGREGDRCEMITESKAAALGMDDRTQHPNILIFDQGAWTTDLALRLKGNEFEDDSVGIAGNYYTGRFLKGYVPGISMALAMKLKEKVSEELEKDTGCAEEVLRLQEVDYTQVPTAENWVSAMFSTREARRVTSAVRALLKKIPIRNPSQARAFPLTVVFLGGSSKLFGLRNNVMNVVRELFPHAQEFDRTLVNLVVEGGYRHGMSVFAQQQAPAPFIPLQKYKLFLVGYRKEAGRGTNKRSVAKVVSLSADSMYERIAIKLRQRGLVKVMLIAHEAVDDMHMDGEFEVNIDESRGKGHGAVAFKINTKKLAVPADCIWVGLLNRGEVPAEVELSVDFVAKEVHFTQGGHRSTLPMVRFSS